MKNIMTITQLVGRIKNILEGEFRNFTIEGEVSNFSLSSSGHYYFTLCDKDAQISAVFFKFQASKNPVIQQIKDGSKVQVIGDVGVYVKGGRFQCIVKSIREKGKGDLKERFELLKRKLGSEGLFDLEAKRPIPSMPKKVAIITAIGGAALQDFINIYKRRSLWMDLVIIPTLVQGETAPLKIRESLHRASQIEPDIIVLARGGGSFEDLFCFSDECLAYDIHNCNIPIISAIGHQVDFTISDFVADFRAETPSAAAELLTQHQTKLKDRIESGRRNLLNSNRFYHDFKVSLEENNPQSILEQIYSVFLRMQKRLARVDILPRVYELTGVNEHSQRLDDVNCRITRSMQQLLNNSNQRLHVMGQMLKTLDPGHVLKRGYSFVTTFEGDVVDSKKTFRSIKDPTLKINFHDGVCEVKK